MPMICFASPKGGVGKTTLAANVAGCLARAGHRVIVLDLDPQNAVRLHFGMSLHDPAGYVGAVAWQPDWRSALRATRQGVDLLPYGQTDFESAMRLAAHITAHPATLAGPVGEMLAQPDRLIVADTMPGPSAQLSAVLPLADLVVTVLLTDAMSVSLISAVETGRAYGRAPQQSGNARRAYVLNQLDRRTRLGPSIAEAAARQLGDQLLATIYRDENVAEAGAAQQMVAEYAPASKAAADIDELARAVAARLPAQYAHSVRAALPA